MQHFLPALLYICFIGFLPLIYVTVKTLSIEKLKSKLFIKLLLKDFIRTFPICALVALPVLIEPKITKTYLMIIQAVFMPLMFLELGHIYLFGVRIGLNTFYSFFVTNMRETIYQPEHSTDFIYRNYFVLGCSVLFFDLCPYPNLFFNIYTSGHCYYSCFYHYSFFKKFTQEMAKI